MKRHEKPMFPGDVDYPNRGILNGKPDVGLPPVDCQRVPGQHEMWCATCGEYTAVSDSRDKAIDALMRKVKRG